MSGLLVERLDCLMLVEDLGRPGQAHLGVPPSGALDPAALALANRLVGNDANEAGLEILLGGLCLTALRSVRIALTGASMPLEVGDRAAPWGAPVSVAAGSRIQVGQATTGLRCWLAVGGGVDVPATLGSRSADTLSGLGPAPLAQGDVLPVGTARAGATAAEYPRSMSALASRGAATVLRMQRGPRDDWFTAASIATMLDSEYQVSTASDRVGVRLSGVPLVRRAAGELASEGLVTGAVQVPGDGQPIVFLADHPTTGGYPVVGVVEDDDLALCAQLRPGDAVRFG